MRKNNAFIKLLACVLFVCSGIREAASGANYATLHQLDLKTPEPDGRRPVGINPPTFRWPVFAKGPYTIELSQNKDFSNAQRFEGIEETFYRPMQPLRPGRYYWRVRTKRKNLPKASFEISEDVTRWAIPPWGEALAKVPESRPRILMRPEDLPRLRGFARGECKGMVAKWQRWAQGVIGKKLPRKPAQAKDLTDEAQIRTMRRVNSKHFALDVASPIEKLCILYLVTEGPAYAKEIRRRALIAADLDLRGDTHHKISDFANGFITLNLGWAYDALHNQWSKAEREKIRNAILGRCRIGFAAYKPSREQRLFAAHGWQHVIQDLTVGALALYHESDEAKAWFDWSFKMHVSLYPWYGGADGGSAEGTTYYKGTNLLTSIKASVLFEAATGVSLFGNPWYQNTPYFLLYTQGLGVNKSQFADGSGLVLPGKHAKTGTILLAHKLQNPYMTTYSEAIEDSTVGGTPDCIRLLWWPLKLPEPKPVSELPKARAFYDVGLVAMRSDLSNPENEIYFELQSSPYGSYNHAHANQNAFNVAAFGERLICDSGYYTAYGDPHHYGWTVRSRAHNTIHIGGKGQGYRDVDAYGEIVDFEIGDGFVRTVGSCPKAYKNAGVKRFDRHVLWLEPDTFLIADDLEIKQPQKFQWLLHSDQPMKVDDTVVTLEVGKAAGRLQFFEPTKLAFTQTDQFSTPAKAWRPGTKDRDYRDQYHLTAETINPASRQRFVSVLQVCRTEQLDQLPEVRVEHDDRGVAISLPDGRSGTIQWRK